MEGSHRGEAHCKRQTMAYSVWNICGCVDRSIRLWYLFLMANFIVLYDRSYFENFFSLLQWRYQEYQLT